MKYKYKAFISYRHSHKKIADKLQKLIETYKPPREYKTNEKIIVFRDETELPTSNNLDESIRENLRRSEYLIVLCSTDFQDSKWCMEELRYFQELHDGTNDNILVVIVDGDVETSIPKSLRTKKFQSIDKYGNKKVENKSIEPLAANIVRGSTRRSLKALKTEFLRLEAVILNCGYDDLYRREHRRKVRKIISFFSVATIVLLSLTMYSLFMFVQINEKNMQISEKNINLQIENSKNLSMMAENEMELKNPFSAIKYAVKALPDETETKPILPSSELTLSNILSVFSYQSDLPYSFMELPGSIKDLEYANDGKTIVVKTTKTDDIKSLSQVARTLYLIDSSNLEIKQSYSDVYDYIIENQNPVYLADKDREDNAEKKKGDIALFFSNSLTIIDCDTYEKKWEKTGDNYMFCKIKYNNNYLPCVLNKANYNIEVYDFSGEMLTSFDISSIIPKTKYGIENLFLSKDKSKAAIIISEYEDSPIKTSLVGYYFEIYDNNIRATNMIDGICKRNFYVHVADVDVEKGFFICTTDFSGSNEESFCLDINNKILWKKDIHIGDESQIQTVEMKNQKYELLIIDDYDCLSMIKAETGEEILNLDHPKEYWKNIELTSNGILYYTTSDAVYCINVCEHFTENKNESKLSKKISTEISLLDFYRDEYIIAERMKRGTSKVYQYKKIFKNKDFQCISEGDDDVNFLGMSPNGKYIIFEDVKYNGSFYPYAKDKVNKVYLYDIETDKKRFIEEYIGYEYGRYFFVNDNILKIGTEYYDVELNPISLALDIALLSKGYNFLDDPDGKMCIIEWLDKDGNYNKSDFDIGSSGQPSKTIISPDKSKILFQYNKEKPNHDSSTDLNSYDTFIISFNNGSYAKCVKADTDLSNYSDCSWINNDEVAFSFIDHVLIIDATSGKTVSDILPYDEKTKYRCNHILANTSGDHKTLLITSFDRKLLKVDRNSGFVKIIQNLSYLESKGEDYKVSLIPGSDDLILTETIHMGGVPATVKSVTYVINTETLGIRYILSGGGVIAYPSGFCGYSEETDSVIIIDGNILGYCPLYTTEELVEKAKNFLKQKDKNFY